MQLQHEQIINRYIQVLLEECGEKNPIRRQAFEEDIRYALQVIEPFAKRYSGALCYDVYAIDSSYKKAVDMLQHAADLLGRFGIDIVLPDPIENPRLIEIECAMAFVDMLRSLEVLSKRGGALFVEEMIRDSLWKSDGTQREKRAPEPGNSEFIRRYVHEKIPERVLDKIAFDEGYLETYLEQLQ